MADTVTSLTSVITKSSSESGSHSSGAVNKPYHYMLTVMFIVIARKIQDTWETKYFTQDHTSFHV
jgi:hypothetical protein